MSKASILALAQTFALGDGDPLTLEQYYDHLMDDAGRAPWFVTASLVTMVAGTSTYALADDQIKILGMFYDDRWLDRMDHRVLESFNPAWRDEKGLPVAYSIEDEATKTFVSILPPIVPRGTSFSSTALRWGLTIHPTRCSSFTPNSPPTHLNLWNSP